MAASSGADEVRQGPAHPPAQEQASLPGGALEMFFELGLPDTRKATWVNVNAPGFQSKGLIPSSYGRGPRFSGNAWLVREDPDGTVELIVNQSERLRGKRVTEMGSAFAMPGSSEVPQLYIAPADLKGDIKILSGIFDSVPSGKPEEEDDFGHGGNRRNGPPGTALLFLAHLDRQGRKDEAAQIAALLLARTSPTELLDAAVSAVADGKLTEVADQWRKGADAAAFASALESLCAEFPRGWRNREAVGLLAQRIRNQKAAPTSNPESKELAELFLAMNQEQFARLPRGRNWLLGDDESAADELVAYTEYVVVPESGSQAHKSDSNDPLTAFFSNKQKAVLALAHLLDDGRMLRVLRQESNPYRYLSSDATDAERLEHDYEGLRRPMELGELAFELLSPLLPERFQYSLKKGARSAAVVAWSEEIADLGEEELAWHYLASARQPSERGFRTAISYLVEKGSAESLTRLREVFLDSAVWSGYSIDPLLPPLRSYLKRITDSGTDVAAFTAKLEKTVKEAIAAREDRGSDGLDAETRKYVERQIAGELKKLEQIIKPQGLFELVKEFASLPQEEVFTRYEATQQAVSSADRKEAEQVVFRVASTTEDVGAKLTLLKMLIAPGGRHFAKTAASNVVAEPIPADKETRKAIKTLLSDTASADEEGALAEDATIRDIAANSLVVPRLGAEDQARLHQLVPSAPALASKWLNARAHALIEDQPPAPWPDPSRVSPGRLEELLQKLSGMAPPAVSPAFQAMTLDEQMAVIKRLEVLPEWPPALVEANFAISDVRADTGVSDSFPVESWKGHVLNAKAREEIETALMASAQKGKWFDVTLRSTGLLSGVQMRIEMTTESVTPDALQNDRIPKIEGKPEPDGFLNCSLLVPGASYRRYYGLLWKDLALTREWKERFGNGAASKEQPSEGTDPAPVQESLAELLALKPGSRGSFELFFRTVAVRAEPEAEATAESDLEP